MDYQLEIKQIVDYPRCRMYREFIRRIMEDRNIRTNGSSYLFYFVILCSYVNFRSSYRRLDGITYLVEPGQWICTAAELSEWFRTRFQHQAISILDTLKKQHYITYSKLGRGNLIKFSIIGWKTSNTALEYNYPCLKDVGFFFFPIAAAHELISLGKASEMDIVLDLWLHTIYQDSQVQGSDKGPVVYFRNGTGNPLTNFSDLALRWGVSKSTVSRIFNKLEKLDYLSLISFPGRHGSVIYLNNYLSTMFQVSDVMIDKEEVSMAFNIPLHIPAASLEADTSPIRDEQICVPNEENSVSKPHMRAMVRKVAKVLATQGIPCCECSRTIYKLYPLSDCMEGNYRYSLRVICPDGREGYHFELCLSPVRTDDEMAGRKFTGGQRGKINSWEDMSMRKKSSIQNETPVNKDSAIYHDTSKLLESYRDAVWNLELAVQQVRHSFEIEFGSSIEEFLDSIYLAGADVGGSKLEEYAKSIERSNKMLNTLMAAVDLLRTKHKHGEQYYWILYYSYLSPQELQNVEEIIEKLKPHIANISQRTYYRKRPKAIEALSTILWGFTSRDCISALNRFCPDENNMA